MQYSTMDIKRTTTVNTNRTLNKETIANSNYDTDSLQNLNVF